MGKLSQVIHEFWDRGVPELKPRRFDRRLTANDLVNDIVGIRRCGKTYLMFCLMREVAEPRSAIYVNFEDRRLSPLSPGVLDDLLDFILEEELLSKFKRVSLFLDEIQNVPGWERFARNLHDEYRGRIKVFVSGSNASLLSEDYGRLLTGRHLTITLFPLSFPEYLDFQGFRFEKDTLLVQRKRALLVKHFRGYLEHGGFPEAVLGRSPAELLRQYYSDIVVRDVTTRARLRKERGVVEAVAQYVITNAASLLSLRRVTAFLNSTGVKITVPTVGYYLRLLEDSFVVFGVSGYSHRVKDQLRYPRKYYCVDNGLRNAVSFRVSADTGRLCENLAAVELRRRGKEVYYWKDAEQHEVDFVVREGLAVAELIQVCADPSDPVIMKRELRALAKAGEELRCRRLRVLTQDFEQEKVLALRGRRTRVKFQPLWKWLIESQIPR